MPTYLVGPSRSLTSIAAVVAAIPSDLAGGGVQDVLFDAGVYPGSMNFSKSNPSASDYIRFRAAVGSEHKMVFGGGVVLSSTTSTAAMALCPNYTQFENIEFKATAAGVCRNSSGNCRFENVLFNQAYDNFHGYYGTETTGTTRFYKCLSVYTGAGTSQAGWCGFYVAGNFLSEMRNCGSYGFNYGIWPIGSMTMVNCWATKYGTGKAFGDNTGGGTSYDLAACFNNASNDSTSKGANGLTNLTTTQFGFNNPTAFNFHLNNSSLLQGAGIDQSSLFTTDIDLETITSWSIGPDFVTPSFPGRLLPTEIIYPVVPISNPNKVVFKLDSEEPRVTLKSSSFRNDETDIVRFRVGTNNMATFLGNLHANKTSQIRLTTPGYSLFGGLSEDNNVRVLTHSRPQREDRGLTQTVDVTFLFQSVFT